MCVCPVCWSRSPQGTHLGRAPCRGLSSPLPARAPDRSQLPGTLLPVCSQTRFSSKHLSNVGGVLVTSRFGEFLAVMGGPPWAQDPVGGWKVVSVLMATQTGPRPTPHRQSHGNYSWTGSRACETLFRSRWEEWGARGRWDPQTSGKGGLEGAVPRAGGRAGLRGGEESLSRHGKSLPRLGGRAR